MRADSFGLFWQDAPAVHGERGPRPMPPIPDTGWLPPAEFPRLDAAKVLAIDTETYDPNLMINGPGWATGDGHIVGISVGTDDKHNWYFPMRHEIGEGNMDPDAVLRWAKDELTRSTQPKIGANLQYDLGWLRQEGVHVKGQLIDVQFAEPLLDEYRVSYSLDAIAETHLNEHKVDADLYNWLQLAYGGSKGRSQAANIYRSPITLCGPYAEGDVDLPMRIWPIQKAQLEEQGLLDLFNMECALIYMLIDMRIQGVRVDINKAEQVNEQMLKKEQAISKKLGGINVNANADLQRAFDKEGISYPNTKKGNPSFTKDFLELCDHPLSKMIIEKRSIAKARGTFVQGYILDKAVNERVHCEFHPLRRDDAGTVSGRFSSSHPNLQNIPARDPVMKKLIRGLFIPEDGERWASIDYSQIEYRFMVHAARGPGAEEARKQYCIDPKTNYHFMTRDLIKALLGRDIEHKQVKNINFGKIFGMGKSALIKQLTGLTETEATEFFIAYDEAVPYAKTTAERASGVAKKRGYIKTILNRRARFPFWEAADWDQRFEMARNKSYIEENYGRAVRARTYKALNCYTQGSGADLLKKAMLDIYNAGLPLPLLTVHDELDWSMPFGTDKIIFEIKEVMEQAIELKIPILADIEIGPNWGELKKNTNAVGVGTVDDR